MVSHSLVITRLRLFSWAAACLMSFGCRQSVDLDSVRTLAATTSASADSYAALTEDFYSSCVRVYDWEWAAARSHAGFPSLTDSCGDNREAANQWQNANLVVLSYIRALGALAGGSDTQTDYGIPKLIDGINSVTGSSLSKGQVSSISTAATNIVTDMYNIRRRNAIATYAPKANDDLDALITVLEGVARTNYSKQLDFETDAVNNFYKPVAPVVPNGMAPAPQGGTSKEPMRRGAWPPVVISAIGDVGKVQLLELRDRYRADKAAVDQRRSAIDAYVLSLEALKTAHKGLVDTIQSNSIGDVAKIVQAYVDQFRPDVESIDRAFGGGAPR